ncbi:aldo/keto reductase [Nonomuraea soli]|uniref:D-threo-aldose 1-dehydrogenase n=1 Tax=Nonomuraea soli TaxID=1032476 RepID=A0A7W0HSL0_9ACTN|nr:aldo/keto reductase [Nonomuraea soli]MBA2894188.1 D-threo-aldose 1-dehydrogenase [Nonomuraea soli]
MKLGFGAAPVSNLYSAVSEEAAHATMEAAWEAGVRYYDTAPHYGLGLSERRLGAFLRGRSGYTLSTKVGRLLVPGHPPQRDTQGFDVVSDLRRVWDFSADGVRRSLDDSLKRLDVDHVDTVLLHDPDDHVEQALDEAYPALERLRSEGVVGSIGIGMNQWQVPSRFVRETDIDVVMLAGRYTLLDRSGRDLLDECAARGVRVLAAGVFNSGLLATHEPSGTYDYAPAPPEVLERARALARLCERHGITLPQAAIAFPLTHPAVSAVVLGMRSADEVKQNTELYGAAVPEEFWVRAADLV